MHFGGIFSIDGCAFGTPQNQKCILFSTTRRASETSPGNKVILPYLRICFLRTKKKRRKKGKRSAGRHLPKINATRHLFSWGRQSCGRRVGQLVSAKTSVCLLCPPHRTPELTLSSRIGTQFHFWNSVQVLTLGTSRAHICICNERVSTVRT